MKLNLRNPLSVFFCLLCIVVLHSCQDDFAEFSSAEESEASNNNLSTQEESLVDLTEYTPAESIIHSNVTGLILDENEHPINGALVTLNNAEYHTDSYGRFVAQNIPINAKGTSYSVHKEGYFLGVRRFFPPSGGISETTLQLVPENIVGSFDSKIGADISADEDLSVSFTPNSIIDNLGNMVDGEVKVSASWIDPQLIDRIPGSLIALNRDLEEESLVSFGIAAVELSVNGVEANLAPGAEAVVTFPISQEQLVNAPNEIPLWSFEEDLGLWIEEGVAHKEGNYYVAQVSHFSFWSVSLSFPMVEISGHFVDEVGNRAAGGGLIAEVPGLGITGYTCAGGGYFQGAVPANEKIVFTYRNRYCEPYSFEVEPLNEDTELGNIELPFEMGLIIGRVSDCSGNPIANSLVQIGSPELYFALLSGPQGHYVAYYPLCQTYEEELFIVANDVNSLDQSPLDYFVHEDFMEVDLQVCGNGQVDDTFFKVYKDGIQVESGNEIRLRLSPFIYGDSPYYHFLLQFGQDDVEIILSRKVYVTDSSLDYYDPSNWGIEVGEPMENYRFEYRDITEYSDPGPPFSYYLTYMCYQTNNPYTGTYYPDCTESEVEATILEMNLNPVETPSSALTFFPAGDSVQGKVIGHLFSGESVEVYFHKRF